MKSAPGKRVLAKSLPVDDGITDAHSSIHAAQVYAWIINGASEDQINEAVQTLWPEQSARPLIIAAMKRIAAAATVNRECLLGWCLESTRVVYQQALEARDFGAALRAIKQLHSLAEGQ